MFPMFIFLLVLHVTFLFLYFSVFAFLLVVSELFHVSDNEQLHVLHLLQHTAFFLENVSHLTQCVTFYILCFMSHKKKTVQC